MQAFALGYDPAIAATRQKITGVQVHGMHEGCGGACVSNSDFEFGDIESACVVRSPLHGLFVPLQKMVRVGHSLAQTMNQVSQIRVSLGFWRVGVEEKGKLLARLRRVAMKEEVGKETLETQRRQTRQRNLVADQTETSEQLNRDRSHAQPPLSVPRFPSRPARILQPNGVACQND